MLNKKKLILLLIGSFLMAFTMSGCSKGDKALECFTKYSSLWASKDYEDMYDMLSSESKQYIDKETFTERYNNIFDAVEAENMDIEVDEEARDKKSLDIPFNINMDTMAGNIDINGYKMSLVEEDKEYKVNWNESLIFPEMQQGDKVMVEDSYAKRGSILDRNGEFLATDSIVREVGIAPRDFENEQDAKITAMAQILDISESYIREQLDKNTNPDYFVPIVTLLDNDGRLTTLSNIEGVKVYGSTSRVYSGGEALGSLVGYIDDITAEELENNKEKGYTVSDKIGKAGLEQVYEDKLRGENGGKIYILRGAQQITIAEKKPVDGEDIKLSIDTELQKKIYEEMNSEKGAATAVDPKTGEVLAMVSSPSYDANVFTTYTSKTVKEAWDKLDGEQFNNRFNDVYAPGSTMKLITAASGLNSGTLKENDTMDIAGYDWQKDESWGGYKVTRVKETSGPIGLREAVKYSDNIFFARVALNMGSQQFIDGLKNFGIGDGEFTFEYPMGTSQISNDGTLDNEILLADTGYGQGEVLVTPLNMALAYSALGNDGDIMQPRLVISENSEQSVYKNAINKEYVAGLIDDFSAVINDSDGMAASAKVEGHNIAGKTGTAEIKESQNDTNGTENGWFVGVDTDESRISIAMVIQDVKDRGGSSIPAGIVQKILSYYLNN